MKRKNLNLLKYLTKTNNNTNRNDEIKSKIKENGLTPEFFPPDGEPKYFSFFQLFRYCTKWERTLIFIAIILVSIGAFGVPYGIIIYGEYTSLIVDRTIKTGSSSETTFLKLFGGGRTLTNGTNEENRLAIIEDSISYAIASVVGAIIQFFLVLIAIDLINYTALNQITRIRKLFFQSILRQDMIWYDTSSRNSNFASKMAEDLEKLKEGIAEKVGIFQFLIMTFIYSIIVSFVYGWKLTLVVLSCTPIIIVSTAFVAKVQSSLTEKELKSYSLAGNVAEEVFSNIRTVVAFSGEEKELDRYAKRLVIAEKTGVRKGLYTGLGSGIMWCLIYCFYALALWYGLQLILQDRNNDTHEYTPGALVIVLFGVLMAAQNLGLTSPLLETFSVARGAAKSIYSVIDRKSLIDSMDSSGLKPNKVDGNIEFKNIRFTYPARSDVEILKDLNLTIEAGQTVAFVGHSGCGKSTCLQLFQRLYDPNQGYITLDDVKISDLNVGWLRSQIGVVGQEPVLFATTIGENILYGNPLASQKDIEDAAQMANCHDFISKLPKGYDTLVGEKGSQMSGGQKQRIAIARAIIRNPKILLLDEATSALDPTSERRVQNALEKASKGRTTLVVSHRLSAVTNADKIIFINNGVVAEHGTHNELMNQKGLYFNLVSTTKQEEEIDSEPNTILRDNLSQDTLISTDTNIVEGKDEKEKETVKHKFKVSMLQLLKLNAPEWKFILVGILAAILQGSSLPIFAIIFGEFLGMLSLTDTNLIAEESNIYSYYFIGLGFLAGIGTLLQFYMFNTSGVLLTTRLRKKAFKKIISQEMGWFDEQNNSVGALCARLSGDCANVQGATGSRIGSLVQAGATLIIGIIISLWYSWSLTLVTIVTIPFVLGSIVFESHYMANSTYEEKLAIECASQVAMEAITNIRTVTSLGQEPYVVERYCKEINNVMLACKKKTRLRGTVFSLGQSAPYAAYGVAFYYGGTLIANEGMEYKNLIKISEALIFGTWMLGQALAYAPNVSAAIISAGRLLQLFERTPKQNNPSSNPYNTIEKTSGNIDYSNVQFHYPTRPETLVLKSINLDIPKGSTVALVGPSGCGKSTCVQLLLRYYDPDSGSINLSGISTTEFPFNTLRSQIGLVSQEPVLFDRTIAENIAYGDNFRDIPMNEIIDAAIKANIHDFVINLPLGYDTSLGSKGAQLSGGQKQRIAIARALVRNPRILILDEATSALDIQSEKIVQDALDSARTGRTCITIAHRLTTVQNADIICVLQKGVIIEKGNHDELIKLNKAYAELYKLQQIHFRYSTKWERTLIFIAIILVSIGAFGLPYGTIIYGEYTSLIVDRTIKTGTSSETTFLKLFGGGRTLTNGTNEQNRLAIIEDSISFAIASVVGSIIQFFLVLVAIDLINYTALNQITRIRKLFFQSILRQDMMWYDTSSRNSNFASKMAEDLEKLKEGIAEKVAIFQFLIMTFIYNIIVSFVYGWKLTLVVLSCTPIIIVSTAFVAKVQTSLTEKELKSYSLAGNVAEEVFSNIRTVVAFSGEEKELDRYSKGLVIAENTGVRKGLCGGLGTGIMWLLIYCCNGLALWYGLQLLLQDRNNGTHEYTPGALVIVLLGVLMAAQNLGLTAPLLETFSVARGAAKSIYSVIDRKSLIDSMDSSGLKPNKVDGNIEFKNIRFTYPARSDVEVLKDLNLTIEAGQTVAFVGHSGCGKSTCLQLFQRLYDPNQGYITLDDVKISDLNVGWLRSQIGVVGQEPVLFATTIGENILYGNPLASQKDIEDAAQMANCHDFISKLPKGYDTLVGEKGSQMSGGQKQRIAIARAIIRNPKILLLDEATSALDPTSERRVQNALEKASKGRTTLVVSHRLSAVTNADKIIFINNGVVAEHGTHNELMNQKGLYFNLVSTTKQEEEIDSEPNTILRDNLSQDTLVSIDTNISTIIKAEKEKETVKDKFKVSMLQLLKLNAPEWKFILVGILAAILQGSSLPIFAIIFGEFLGLLSLTDTIVIAEESNIYSYYFIGLGFLAGIGALLQFYMFTTSGVLLTTRLRKKAFKKIISQEMGWFDEQNNSVGALCARLSGDCANVQGATGSRIGVLVQAAATLIIGITISLWVSWSLTLVTSVTIPCILGSIFFEAHYMASSTYEEKLAIEGASQVAIEAITNIRTVTSLGQEPYVVDRYCKKINNVMLACKKKTRLRGTVFSLSQAVQNVAYGFAFYYGGTLIANEGMEYKDLIKITEALILGTWMLGQALAYAPNVSAAIISAGRLLQLFERTPKQNNPSSNPYNAIEKISGNIDYSNVQFHYPTRPETLVLKSINLDIPKGSTVALVGPSGCGKSTCVQLLLRYYDPDSGSINLSGISTTEFPFNTLRSQIGLVSQEPVLFDRTIAENIAYGDNFRDIPMNEIIDAAIKANIHDFVINLPLGYDTSLGSKGAQLSGGQKQRIAIARALVRNPRILILDEATSALDIQSEKIVQDALDSARTGRTCITIAHRLTTVQNADIICVLKKGVIIEKGNHDELIKLNKAYAELYKLQQIH